MNLQKQKKFLKNISYHLVTEEEEEMLALMKIKDLIYWFNY